MAWTMAAGTPVEAAESDSSAALPLASTPPTQPDAPPSQQRPRRRPRTQPSRPEPGSLYDILCANSGMSLFVLPILWSDHHPRLLGAEFAEHAAIRSSTPSPLASRGSSPGSAGGGSPTAHRPSQIAEELNYDLTTLLTPSDNRPFHKCRAIKNVLSTLFKPVFSRPKSVAELDMHFGNRVFRSAVRVPVLWKSADAVESSFDSAVTRPVSSFGHVPNAARETNDYNGITSVQSSQGVSDGAVLAYVNRSHLGLIRKNLFRIVLGPESGDRQNTPVSRLQALRSKQLVPTDLDQDAYLLAVFIAMAQSHFYEPAPSRIASQVFPWNNRQRTDRIPTQHAFYDVKLRILTHDDDTSDFIVYTTVVTAAFLKRFAEPLKAAEHAQDRPGLHIEFTRVPVWPILGLRERLGKALGRDLVGDVQEVNDLFDEIEKDEAKDDAEGETSTKAGVASEDSICNGDAERAACYKEARAATQQQGAQGRLNTLKRKRPDSVSLSEVLVVSFDSESNSHADGNSSSSGTTVGPSPAAAAAVAMTSPTLSPRKKRRQTRRSLSSSSLAVF